MPVLTEFVIVDLRYVLTILNAISRRASLLKRVIAWIKSEVAVVYRVFVAAINEGYVRPNIATKKSIYCIFGHNPVKNLAGGSPGR